MYKPKTSSLIYAIDTNELIKTSESSQDLQRQPAQANSEQEKGSNDKISAPDIKATEGKPEPADPSKTTAQDPASKEQDSRDGYLEPIIYSHDGAYIDIGSVKQADPQIDSLSANFDQIFEFIPDPDFNNNPNSTTLLPPDGNQGGGGGGGIFPDLGVLTGQWSLIFNYSTFERQLRGQDFIIPPPTNKTDELNSPDIQNFSIQINSDFYTNASFTQIFSSTRTANISLTEKIREITITDFTVSVFVPPTTEVVEDFSISFTLHFTNIQNLVITLMPPDSMTEYLLYDPATLPMDAFAFDGVYTFSLSGMDGFLVENTIVTPGDYTGNIQNIIDGINATANMITPVVLDLNNDGLDLTSVTEGVLIDANLDGNLDNTNWIGKEDGILVFDADQNKSFTDVSEIAFADYHQDATTDLEGLALVFDTNQDNVLNAKDDNWDDFYVWQDLNQNAISEEGELKSLDTLGIKEILLVSDGVEEILTNSAVIHGTTSYTNQDGSKANAYDVSLVYSSTDNLASIVDASLASSTENV